MEYVIYSYIVYESNTLMRVIKIPIKTDVIKSFKFEFNVSIFK